MKKILLMIFLLTSLLRGVALAEGGEVKIPLDRYGELVRYSQTPAPRPAPAGYALGQSNIDLKLEESKGAISGEATVLLKVKVIEDQWTLIPLLPFGAALREATVDGTAVELINAGQGLGWGTNKSGSYQLRLVYRIDAMRFEQGYSLALPLPQSTSHLLHAVVPGSGLDVAVIPSAGSQTISEGATTVVNATLPSTTGLQLSWRSGPKQEFSLSRAHYRGELQKDGVVWQGEFQLELFQDQAVMLPLFPSSVTLSDLQVDGKPASIFVEDDSFSVQVKGRGLHKISVDLQVPLEKGDGPASLKLSVPHVPVSQFDLTLPGKKEVQITPASAVSYRTTNDTTIATAYVPMTEGVSLSWTEAVPEEIKAELRANANLYHAVHAEEGTISVHALITYEITRGETNLLQLALPKGAEINRISSPSGAIADWRLAKRPGEGADLVEVFLDRQLTEGIQLDVFYDRSILGKKADEKISLPLLQALSVQRQRGMVALLSSKELTLKPLEENRVTKVGENQLPPFVRQEIHHTVAHTYKYVEGDPQLIVQVTAPERKEGRFDAEVNTLISLSDVTMRGSASIEVNVKSGTLSELQLSLPTGVNLLNLTTSSLRTYKITPQMDHQEVDIQFTQDLEGQFRIEVAYEFIMNERDATARVPTLNVKGAEIEQGKIGVEALSAVEVQAASNKTLSALDPNELPQQLIMKTTNPILLAYKYVRVDAPHDLTLKITRHKEIDVQTAAIDRASYKTLYTEDGLAVTAAEFIVKNTREQFLRVTLPEGSTIWSAFVNGSPEKPALAEAEAGKDGAKHQVVLIKIINSAQGFPVSIVYQTPVSSMGSLGFVRGVLPNPAMVVTRTFWDVFLPDTRSYGTPETNLHLRNNGEGVLGENFQREVGDLAAGAEKQRILPLQIVVPTSGRRFSFDKLYANQGAADGYFSLPYVSQAGGGVIWFIVAAATALAWLGLAQVLGIKLPLKAQAVYSGAVIGLALLALLIGKFGASYGPAVVVSVGAFLMILRKRAETRAPLFVQAEPGLE